MFKFRKVREPEQIDDKLISLEESANRLENIVETAQKEKSRFNLLVEKVSNKMASLDDNVQLTKTEIAPQLDSLAQRQIALSQHLDEMTNRINQTELQLKKFANLSGEFENTVARISQESARITTWMAANEKMASDLADSNQTLETIKHKVDQLHELAEYVDTKTRALAKNKELLKNAHSEYSNASILLVDIKSNIAEMSREFDRLRKAKENAEELNNILSTFETRFEKIESESALLNQLLNNYANLENYARDLKLKRQSFESIDRLLENLSNHTENAHSELAALQEISGWFDASIKQASQLQNDSKSTAQQMAELVSNAQTLLERLPEVNTILKEIETVRQRALSVENKLMENLAIDSELKEQAADSGEIRLKVESYRQESAKAVASHKKELEYLSIAMNGLKGNLDSLRSRWLEMPEILSKLAETEKRCIDVEKRRDSLAERTGEIDTLKSSLDQHAESFKRIENLAAAVHQKGAEIIGYRAELEKIELRMSAINSGVNTLIHLGEKVEKQNNETALLFDSVAAINNQIRDSEKVADSIAKECDKMRRNQENLRLDAGEVMDLFGKLSDLRTLTEEKSREANNIQEQTQARVNLLNQTTEKAQAQIETYRKIIADLKDEIKELNRGQQELHAGYINLDKESAKMADLTGSLKNQQESIANFEQKLTALEKRLDNTTAFENKLTAFESTLQKNAIALNEIVSKAPEVDKLEERIERFGVHLNEIDAKLAGIADTTAEVDRLYRQFSKISLMAEGLKARERALTEEERLVNRAITAAANLEELILRAEQIGK
jgi:chromosome segregation ATPase